MLTSVRSLMAATVLAGAAIAATPAMAQEEEGPGITISGSAAIVTDYRFRGVGLSGGDPAIQGGISVSTDPGFYVGVWGSSLEDTATYGEMELDIYGGWAGDITDGVGVDVGATYYAYPSNDVGPADVIEFYGKVKPTLGPVGLTFGVAYAPKQDSLGGTDNLYLSADASIGVPNTPISLTGHVGYSDGGLVVSTADGKAWDWSVGGSVTVLGGLSLGVSYIGLERDPGFKVAGETDDAVVGTLSFAF